MSSWPDGTTKSTGNAFNWRAGCHTQLSIFAQSSGDRTPLFNKWLQLAQKPVAGVAAGDWPAYRAYHESKEEENRIRRLKRHGKKPVEGWGNGTITGLSSKADKLLQPKPDGLRMKRAGPGTVKPMHHVRPKDEILRDRHGGAYSKAVPKC